MLGAFISCYVVINHLIASRCCRVYTAQGMWEKLAWMMLLYKVYIILIIIITYCIKKLNLIHHKIFYKDLSLIVIQHP